MDDFIVLCNGLVEVTLCKIGASIYDIKTPDKNGFKDSILVTTNHLDEFAKANSYFGKTIGRTGGRISNSKFILDGIEYKIQSDDPNGLHGGIDSLSYKKFDYEIEITNDYKSVIFKYRSPDMESGYPGNCDINVRYNLYINENKLEVIYEAKTDKKTILNLANHAYFNLSGSISENIVEHHLYINSSKMERIENLIPTEIIDTPKIYSFKEPHQIKDYLFSEEIINNTNGYDYPYIFDNVGIDFNNIVLTHNKSGRRMTINTSYPVVVVYTCNYTEDIEVNNGKKLKPYDAVCLECMYHPNTINSDFLENKKDILNPEDKYYEKVVYSFDTI